MGNRWVMTFEMISNHIWVYNYDWVENIIRAIHNIMGRIKPKLKAAPGNPQK